MFGLITPRSQKVRLAGREAAGGSDRPAVVGAEKLAVFGIVFVLQGEWAGADGSLIPSEASWDPLGHLAYPRKWSAMMIESMFVSSQLSLSLEQGGWVSFQPVVVFYGSVSR